MERIRLSNSMVFQKSAVIIFFIIYAIALISSFSPYGLVFILVFVLMGYRIFFLPDKLEFDNEHMYIIYKDGETEVNLKDVFYIRPMGSFLDRSGLGKIKYHYNGSDYYAQFLPRYFSSSFKKFREYVSEKNPNVNIIGYSPTSLFDD